MIVCQHCRRGRVARPRGLCWNCYYTPGVRERYPITSKFGKRGPGTDNRRVRRARLPTSALPGSLEKILVLARRAELGEELWHPEDAPFERESRLARVG